MSNIEQATTPEAATLGVNGNPLRERFGFRIGGSSTDIVMLFMNDQALQRLLSDKFKIGADATAAAGPVEPDYNATYGTLGAAIAFSLWLFWSNFIILIGAEINAKLLQTDRGDEPATEGSATCRDTEIAERHRPGSINSPRER